jgi:hypothetical protein
VCRKSAAMEPVLLHGTMHATIFEGRNMTSERKTGGAPAFFRKVSSPRPSSYFCLSSLLSVYSSLGLNCNGNAV